VEREATHRAITLSELSGARVLIVHVSSAQALEQIEWAQRRGLRVLAETCPHYLIDVGDPLSGEGWEPAKYLCSPPPRGGDNALRLWSGVSRGIFQLLSSDHCPYRFEGTAGKRGLAADPHFRHVPPGMPGIEARLPLLYDAGVLQGRISAQQFVALTSTNPARTYGLYPRKGSLAPGSDADLVLWDPRRTTVIRHESLHDACDYTPYEGLTVGAWPVTTLARGAVIWDRGWVSQDYGRGEFLPQGVHP
jgi:dihydropyrimidinase